MSTSRKISSSVKDFVLTSLSEVKSELDREFCLKNNVQFKNDEIDAQNVELFSDSSMEEALKILGKK